MAYHDFVIKSGLSSDGYDATLLYHEDKDVKSYLQVRNSTVANNSALYASLGGIGQRFHTGDLPDHWIVYRIFLLFKQAYNLVGAPVESTYISFLVDQILTDDGHFDIVIQKANSTDIHHQPPIVEDFNVANIENTSGGSKNTSDMVESWVTITLNGTGASWVGRNIDDELKVVLRSSDDIDAISPTQAPGTYNTIAIYTGHTAVANRPYLTMRVTLSIPTATTQSATSIGTDRATFNGTITNTGWWLGSYGFEWKEGVGGDVSSIQVGSANQDITTFSYIKTGLSSATTYYFRAWGNNGAGKGYGSWVDFTTVSETAVVTTQAATQIGYQSAMGNGTIVSGDNITERGFEIKVEVDYFGVGGDIWWGLIGFDDEGGIVYSAGQRTGTLIKRETETGSFSAGVFAIVLGYADILGAPSAVFNDALMKCESYTYRAYATNDVGTGYGAWTAFDTLCDAGSDTIITDDISDANPTVPIIPIEAIEPIELVYPKFVWEIPEWEFPPWILPDLPDWAFPDYPPMSFVGDFYYRRPYTKKDLDDLRKKCIIYNKNSVEFALVLRHNMNVLREFFNMMTEYLGKDEFNDFTDLIPPQRLKELYLDPLELNDFRDMINEFIRNTVNNNMAVNRNFKLIEEGTADDQTNNEEGTFVEINSNIKTVTEDNPDAERLKRVIDNLNQEVSLNFGNIMHNLKIVRARLL